MERKGITAERVLEFGAGLRREEKSAGTVGNYLRHVGAFAAWLGERPVTRQAAAGWKAHLLAAGYAPGTVNGMVAALNRFFDAQGWGECRVRAVRVQRRLFREDGRELTRGEYARLLAAARRLGRERLALLMEAVCAKGIRVSEVRFLTVEAVRRGRAEISLKGKVFPHNLRHLFARAFYQVSRDVSRLADVLGHSSMETTRLYLMTSGAEHARQLERLGLVS